MNNNMEQWEIDLRSKLDKELPDGCYMISEGNFVVATGKGGKIEYEVALVKAANNYIETGEGIQREIEKSTFKRTYSDLTEQDIIDFMNDLENKDNEQI
jgi:hypothetical protein